MRRRTSGLAAVAVAIIAARIAIGCAQASDDPGSVTSKCPPHHTCGATSGGDGGTLDSEPFGDVFTYDVPHIDSKPTPDSPGVDTTPPPGEDSSPPPPMDTGTVGTDTGPGCPIPTGKACGWSPQCGCSSSQNCDFTAVDGTVACETAGSVGVNGLCTGLGQCAKGLSCIAGICMPFCTTASDCTGSGTPICHAVNDGGSPPKDIPGYLVCMQQCDPRAPASICGSGVGCGIVDGTAGQTTCTAAGTGGDTADCSTNPFSCSPGFTCVNTGTAQECLAWCRVGHSGDCSGGLTCVSFSDHPTYKGTEYGVCN